MVERKLPKLETRVRFPSPAPLNPLVSELPGVARPLPPRTIAREPLPRARWPTSRRGRPGAARASGTSDGRCSRWNTKTFKRRQDADAFRRTVEADELPGLVVGIRKSSQRFGDYAGQWLETRRRPDGRPLAALTVIRYRDLLRRLIMPTFGGSKLAAIQPSHGLEA